MGINIYGYIEIRHAFMLEMGHEAGWYGVVQLDQLLDTRDYLMYHSLFGIRDDTDFAPLAAGRGLPHDISDAVRIALNIEEGDEYALPSEDLDEVEETWITFQELQVVDWEETAMTAVALEYKEGQQPERGLSFRADHPRRIAGVDFKEGGSEWKFERITRRESLGAGGPLLYDLMEALAKHLGAEHVRAVVWFG